MVEGVEKNRAGFELASRCHCGLAGLVFCAHGEKHRWLCATHHDEMCPSRAPTEHIMQFFKYEHLKPEMQAVSKPFCELAAKVLETLPRNPERTEALRKILEAKDCAVRAFIAVE